MFCMDGLLLYYIIRELVFAVFRPFPALSGLFCGLLWNQYQHYHPFSCISSFSRVSPSLDWHPYGTPTFFLLRERVGKVSIREK